MRLSVLLLIVALAGVIGGAALIARWAVGCAVIADSLAVAAWAIWVHDDGVPLPQRPQALDAPDLVSVLERARGSG